MPAFDQTITAELQQWIVTQIEAGIGADELIVSMRASGWDAPVAKAAIAQSLRQRLAQLGPDADADADESQPAAATKLPGGPLDSGAALLDAAGHPVRLLASLRLPRVRVLGGLLSEAECEALMALAAPRLNRSETVDTDTGGNEVNVARTSEGMFFERGETALIQTLEARIAALLDWPVDHGEGLQVLRYRPGAEYRPHHDYFDPAHAGTASILKRGGQRLASLVIYLNTPTGGGATTFPETGFEVAPLRGNAVFFSYDRAHPDTRTLHGGAPVTAGEKWVATKWLRQGVFT